MASTTQQTTFDVSNKNAIITGAGSGINLCFARLLLTKNCNVVIADIALRPEAQELIDAHSSKQSGQARAVFVKTDVRLWDDLTEMFDVAEREFGGADIVCPGAGVFEPHWSNFWHPPGSAASKDPVHGTDGIGHYALFDINVTHPIRTTQIAIARWLNPAEGSKADKVSPSNPKRMVLISSIAGQVSGIAAPLYHASKHAMNGFIRSLAHLDTIGVRVNGVAPGLIRTPLWMEHPEKLKFLDQSKDEWVEPEEVAEAMLRCCEDDEVVGGYIMEVLKERTRPVHALNDPGPSGPGAAASNMSMAPEEVLTWLAQPGWGMAK